jgi:hypothetical protein
MVIGLERNSRTAARERGDFEHFIEREFSSYKFVRLERCRYICY